jgi:hypothetical protein
VSKCHPPRAHTQQLTAGEEVDRVQQTRRRVLWQTAHAGVHGDGEATGLLDARFHTEEVHRGVHVECCARLVSGQSESAGMERGTLACVKDGPGMLHYVNRREV